jgi:hypothetical protein
LVFYRKDPRKKQRLAIGSLIDLNRRIRVAAIQNPGRRLTGGEGKMGK